MCPSLIQIGSKTAEKNSAQTNKQTNKQTDRHYEHNGHLAVNQLLHTAKKRQQHNSKTETARRWRNSWTVVGGQSTETAVDDVLERRTHRQLHDVLRSNERLVNVQHCQHGQTQLQQPYQHRRRQTLSLLATAEAYLHAKFHLDPSSRLATVDMGRKLGGLCPFLGEVSSVPI